MGRKKCKNGSKRLTLRKKHKIEKKIREHHRKVRKSESTKKKKKDPGFPADVPFMQRVLQEAREVKMKMSEDERKLQERLFKQRQQPQKAKTEVDGIKTGTYKDQLLQVMHEADVILMVLDARDPIGTQCPFVDSLCTKMGKKLVYVLNKIDLVPRENARQWVAYLRRQRPTVPFKCNTQEQASRLGALHKKFNAVSDEKIQKSSMCFGVKDLLSLLANYCRGGEVSTSMDQQTSETEKEQMEVTNEASTPAVPTNPAQEKMKHIKVGIVGLPNTGKSSLVNSLKRSRVCNSANVAGTTKHCQIVTLDRHIQLIDSPGIVLASSASDSVQLALKNMIRPDQITDSEAVVEAIVRRCGTKYLQDLYQLPDFDTLKQFMVVLAQRFSCYEKGGILSLEKSNRILIRDWIQGKIKYFTKPPESEVTTELLPELSAPFDMVLETDAQVVEVENSSPVKTVFEEDPTADATSEEENDSSDSEDSNSEMEAD